MVDRAKNSTIENVALLADCGIASTSHFIGLPRQDDVGYIAKPLRFAARQAVRPASWMIVDDDPRDDGMASKPA